LSLIKNITEILLERDYRIIPQLCGSTVIGNDSKYITFFKYSGTSLYGVSLINSAVPFDYREVYSSVRSSFYSHAKSVRCSKAYFIGLFIGNEETLTDFCTIDIDDYTAFNIEVRWIIDPNKEKIIVKGSQPDKIIDLKKLLETALSKIDSSYSPDAEIGTLVQNEADKRRSTVKSNNIVLTLTLIVINILMLAITYLSGGTDIDNLISLGAVNKALIFENAQYYRLFTSMFLHCGIAHLLSNMLFLYVFGSSIERYYGKIKFLIIYLGSDLAGNILYCLVSNGIAVGASGATFGLTGAILGYSLRIKRAVDGKDTYFMVMFLIISLCSGFLNIIDTNVANSAHIGGFIFGLVSGLLLCNTEN